MSRNSHEARIGQAAREFADRERIARDDAEVAEIVALAGACGLAGFTSTRVEGADGAVGDDSNEVVELCRRLGVLK